MDETLDPQERPAATSSFMYEMILPLDKDFDFCSESLSGRGIPDWLGIRPSLAMVGTLSRNLTQMRHLTQYRDYEMVEQMGPHEFELGCRLLDKPLAPRYKPASLSTLELLNNPWADIRQQYIIMCSTLTYLPALIHLKSECQFHRDALAWLTANSPLASLKTLDINLHSECISQSPLVLIDFLCGLPPLEGLALAGEIHTAQSDGLISVHASTLKRLQLKTIDRSDTVFDLMALRALTKTPLLLLEHLSITIKRSKGDSDEVSAYKILGTMPRLQSIILGLDCSDVIVSTSPHEPFVTDASTTEFWQQTWPVDENIHDRCPTFKNFRDALINSAVDEKLAKAIFRTISAAKSVRWLPLERLEVRPSGGCDFGGSLRRFSPDWSAVMQHIECSWLVKRKYPGLGSDVLSVSQIQSQRPGKKCRIPAKLETIFRRVFPVRAGTEGDWQKDWHSFPLEQQNQEVS